MLLKHNVYKIKITTTSILTILDTNLWRDPNSTPPRPCRGKTHSYNLSEWVRDFCPTNYKATDTEIVSNCFEKYATKILSLFWCLSQCFFHLWYRKYLMFYFLFIVNEIKHARFPNVCHFFQPVTKIDFVTSIFLFR